MKKFMSQIVTEQRLNIKVYRDYFCSNKKVYKENYYALIDFIMDYNDRLQIRQLYYFINKLTENNNRDYVYYFHQKYYNKFAYIFINGDSLKYYLNLDLN